MFVLNFNNNNSKVLEKGYDGNNGYKLCVLNNGKHYLVKFPYEDISSIDIFNNNIYCEYIGSKIFNMLGVKAQKVSIINCSLDEGKGRCVACEDFTFSDYDLQEFAKIKNKEVNSKSKGYNSDLNEIIKLLEKLDIKHNTHFKDFFWDMFIVDAFIGNYDRHNGNWGFLYNKKTNEIKLAPIYDCESSLISTISKEYLTNLEKNNYNELEKIINISSSAIHINNNSINYVDYITSLKNKDCNNALFKIVQKINLNEINNMIDDIDGLNVRIKNLYKKLLEKRKELILDKAYNKLLTIENRNELIDKNKQFIVEDKQENEAFKKINNKNNSGR